MSLNMRRYFVTACDPETQEPMVAVEIKAPCFSEAMERTGELARNALGGRTGRITGITEQPEESDSYFLRRIAEIGCKHLEIARPS